MKLLFCLLVLSGLSLNANAEVCRYSVPKDGVKVRWTAFKTPKKVGVVGEFKSTDATAPAADSITQLVAGASFTINSRSVATGNTARDRKIVNNFFVSSGAPLLIRGWFINVTSGSATALLTLGAVTKEVPMRLKTEVAGAQLSGNINVLDFALGENLARITRACYALHEGVTWPDVEVNVTVPINKSCR